MANDLNNCSFIGRLGSDPESRFTPSNDQIVNFRIAVGWKGKTQEGVEWVPVVAFGKLAEICAQYLKKGSQVFISGRFRTRKWQAQDGSDRYSTEIVADKMQMLGGKPEGKHGPKPTNDSHSEPHQSAPNYDDFDDSEIPF